MNTEIDARQSGLKEIIQEVRSFYEERYPVKESGFFSPHDWERCQALAERVVGSSLLDVGIGAGQIFNVLAKMPSIDKLVGIDVRWNKKLIRPDRGVLELHNILSLPFEDNSFDTVSCMEVLEHLEIIDFAKGLSELRRVCRSRLIMTIPYKEPEPVWHHDVAGGHRQSFSEDKIERFFPRAKRHLISRGPKASPWIMLIEQEPR